MKKKISVLLIVVMALAIMLAGCGGDEQGNAEGMDKVKAGFIYIGAANDGGYSQVHEEGRQAAVASLGEDRVETVVAENIPEDQTVEGIMNDMIDQGCNIIFANSFNYQPFVEAVAKENPDVNFMHFSGSILGENYGNYFGRMYQPRYLTGIVAGMTTENNKIGYVAAHPTPEVIRGINAFTLGVRSVNPDANVYIVWTNTWYDPAVEKQAAEALLDGQGVDTICQHQDTTAAQQAAAEHGAYSVGYNMDMSQANEEGFLVSAVWHLGAFYTDQLDKMLQGTWEPTVYWGSMADGVVGLSDYGPAVSQEAKDAVAEAQDKIFSGEWDVFTGPIYDNQGNLVVEEGQALTDEEMLSMMWLVEGVIGEVPASN